MKYSFAVSGNVYVTNTDPVPYHEIPEYAQMLAENAEASINDAFDEHGLDVYYPPYDTIAQTQEDTITRPLVVEIPIRVEWDMDISPATEGVSQHHEQVVSSVIQDVISCLGFKMEVNKVVHQPYGDSN